MGMIMLGQGDDIPDGLLNQKTVDCSSYVSWVLYCTGYEQFKGPQATSYTFYDNSWHWDTVSIEDAAPGDILVYQHDPYHHVEIIAANPEGDKFWVYNCGSDSSIAREGTAELPEAELSGWNKTGADKILRPSK